MWYLHHNLNKIPKYFNRPVQNNLSVPKSLNANNLYQFLTKKNTFVHSKHKKRVSKKFLKKCCIQKYIRHRFGIAN